jgi:ribonuclease VapC
LARYVLDSSVVIAILRREQGIEGIEPFFTNACISTVILAEIVTKCIELGIAPQAGIDFVADSDIELVELSAELAVLAGQLRRRALKGVLSLGDRACIATAIKLGGTAVTADRIWAEFDLGCEIELIR